MPVAPSFNDLVDQYIAEALTRRPDLEFIDGSVTLADAHAAAAMADAAIRMAARYFAATFIDLAKGDDLTALVDDHLGLQRQEASEATTVLTFTRTSSTAASETLAAGLTVATAVAADGTEIRFTLDTALTFGIGVAGPLTVNATAADAGRDGNVAAGTLTRIIDTTTGSYTVTNASAAAGGNDEESDEQLRLRARTFWSTLRRGTLAALEQGALTVPTVRVARATEDASGLVTVLVTDEDGNSNADMVADVTTALEEWRAAGTVVQVTGGSVLAPALTVTVYAREGEGFDVAAFADTIEAALTARMAKLRTGETRREDQLTAAVIAVDPDGIDHVEFSPAGDLTPTSTQVIRAGAITVVEG